VSPGVLTRLGRLDLKASPVEEVAPGLLYQKWHGYDETLDPRGSLAKSESHQIFLEQVAKSVHRRVGGADRELYDGWYKRYRAALRDLGVEEPARLAGTTLWRLVAGFAANPALESGLHLYPLYGFPYLPGSSVRGLVHHVAEMDLIEREERSGWRDMEEPPEAAALDRFLDEAAQVRALFGSLTVEPISQDRWRQAAGDAPRRETPRSLLRRWLARAALQADDRQPQARRARALLAGQTGGLAVFYDAVPDPGTADILQVDILNPHYPDYYHGSLAPAVPPSDDQNPVPVYFLAVRPGAHFIFPFRLAPWPERPTDPAGDECLAALGPLTRDEAQARLESWLARGLGEWGAGAKTAAGYGYFALDGGAASSAPSAEGSRSAPDVAAGATRERPPVLHKVHWSDSVKGIAWGDAEDRVPSILANYEGDDRKRAAIEVVKLLGRRKLLARKEKPWTSDLLEAAGLL
jgi:CRISPR type III-B/RAMP module RAMP protein Cmr6